MRLSLVAGPRALGLVCLAMLAAFAGGVPAASAAQPCSAAPSGRGEWPVYGHDTANTRSQPNESVIGTVNASSLHPAWVFATGPLGDATTFDTTPVVSGGCSFIGSSGGTMYAVNMTDGHLVWKRFFPVSTPGLGGTIVGAAAVDGAKVIVAINASNAPYVVALDRATGATLWTSAPISTRSASYTNGSPIVVDGLVVLGYSGTEGADAAQGGFALLNAATGAIVKTTDTIPPDRQAQGYAGGGLWSVPAYDPATHLLYWGTGNPSSKVKADPNTDAIVKIDLNRGSPTFGQIVDRYQGNVDQYLNALKTLEGTPVCAVSDLNATWPLDDPACGQLDLDFGASVNLWHDGSGRTVIGDLQKSGVYHAAFGDTMQPDWATIVGLSCAACNAASGAFDGLQVEGVGTPGGTMFALSSASGSIHWLHPLASGGHYEGTSVANGVAYTIDDHGILHGVSAASGLPVLVRLTALDVGTSTVVALHSNGLAIAEGAVVAPINSTTGAVAAVGGIASPSPLVPGAFLVAYR